jgi:hypothetical protein
MKQLLLATCMLVALAGCNTLQQEVVLPGQTPSTPQILLGHVPGGLPAGFSRDAESVTREAVLDYIALSDQITAAGGVNAQAMVPLVSPEWWVSEQDGFSYFVEKGLRTYGTSEVTTFLVQSARITSLDTVEVGVIACVDTTAVFLLPGQAADPPESVWQWHPHYEDFEGDSTQWAAIEVFLEQPGLSWGSPEPVVFWFEGPTMDSLVLTSSELWWGVYPCV